MPSTRGSVLRAALIVAGVSTVTGDGLEGQRYTPPAVDVDRTPMRASCAPDAAADVDRGVALLMLLAAVDARRAFERAATADPDCALGYWGQAMSVLPATGEALSAAALDAGAIAARRAAAVPIRTPVERGLVDSITTLFAPAGQVPIGVRLDAYESRLRQLAQSQPDADALIVLHARAALLRSTMPADEARVRARRVLEAAFRDRPLSAGAAVSLLEASDGRLTPPALERAADALARVRLPGPHHLLLRAFVSLGAWDRAVRAGEAALSHAGASVTSALLYGPHQDLASEWLVESYLQLGRREAARALLARLDKELERLESDDPANRALRRGVCRSRARVVLDERATRSDSAMRDKTRDALADDWSWRFSQALVNAWQAWPGGNQERLHDARQNLAALEDANADGRREPERDLARTLVEAAIAASQDEHPQAALLLAHAIDLEARLTDTGRLSLPLQPARELSAEIWQRAYLYPDAEREARAALDRHPNRWRVWLTLARAAAAHQRPDDSTKAYRRLAELRAGADANDAAREEARAALAR